MNRRSLMLALPFAACASLPQPGPNDIAFIAPRTPFRIPPPTLLSQTVAVAQTVQANYAGAGMLFEAQIAITPEGLDLAVLDTLGRRALSIAWHGPDLEAQVASWLPDGVTPANMLADIALLYWPEALLAPALLAAGARLEATPNHRIIFAEGQEVIRVEYRQAGWGGQALLRNLAFGYSLTVHSVLIAP